MQLLVQQMPLQWHSSFINKLCSRLCLLVSLLWDLYDVHQENRLSWEWATNKQLRLLYHVFEKGVISGKELAEKKSLVLDILHKQQSMIIHFQDKNPAHIMSSKLSSAPEPQQAFCHQVRLACLNLKLTFPQQWQELFSWRNNGWLVSCTTCRIQQEWKKIEPFLWTSIMLQKLSNLSRILIKTLKDHNSGQKLYYYQSSPWSTQLRLYWCYYIRWIVYLFYLWQGCS